MSKKKIVVIGAGISGLLSALCLSKNGHDVVVLESTDKVGGACRSYLVGDYKVDTGPHIITRLEDGPLKYLMDSYFMTKPIFVPHGEYFVRNKEKTKPFPWTLRSFAMFDMIPKKDRLYLLQTVISLYSQRTLGMLDEDIPVLNAIDKKSLDATTLHFFDVLCRFMTGVGMDKTPIARFFDSQDYKNHNEMNQDPLDYFNGLRKLITKKGGQDQNYPRGGIQSIIECIMTSMPKDLVTIELERPVRRINDENGRVTGVETDEGTIDCDIVVYSSYSSELPDLIDSLPPDYQAGLKTLEKVLSLTLWLGLDKEMFTYKGSEIWIGCEPPCWVVPTSNYDSSLAPDGHQLVGFTTNISLDSDIEEEKNRFYTAIANRVPDIRDHVRMVHWQVLVPEKAAWVVNQEMPSCETPIEGLYLVGTDTTRKSMGITRASYSVINLLDTLEKKGDL